MSVEYLDPLEKIVVFRQTVFLSIAVYILKRFDTIRLSKNYKIYFFICCTVFLACKLLYFVEEDPMKGDAVMTSFLVTVDRESS